jgi:hypothetical protein
VLSAIPVYLLTSLKVPKQLHEDLDKARRRFLWAGDGNITGGKCKVGWVAVAKPVAYGGLGILDLEKFSRALRLRWLWFAWLYPDRSWVGTELPIDAVDESLFIAATRVTVHNGHKASFWRSSWINGQAPSVLFPLLYSHSRRKNRTVRNALQEDRWIRDVAYSLNSDLLRDFFSLWNLIQLVHLDFSDTQED